MNVTMIKHPTDEDWIEVKKRALVTMGLAKVINAPTTEWKRDMLEARHSPIRFLTFSFFIENMPYWLSVELCRHHEGCEKFVKSQRNDRQENYDRNSARQDAPVNMIFDCNAEALMVIMNKRLCGKATKEMRELMVMMRRQVIHSNPEFDGLLVPACTYYNGKCHELVPCGVKDGRKG